jgi:hypothetical protein
MTRSRLFSLALTAGLALAGLGVGTAATSLAGPAGGALVSSHPPVCC